MKIICLVENTEGTAGCGVEHGLCLYVETEKHKLLMDTGASDLLLANAAKKGVDLGAVDTVVLSHGHSDHGGGIAAFVSCNPTAKIYMQVSAEGAYYSHHNPEEEPKYIGLDPELRDLPQIIRVNGDYRIDDELSLISGIRNAMPVPATNRPLKRREGDEYLQDDFRHEQCLLIREGRQTVLLSGCCHHGIRNVLSHYRALFGSDPDAVIGGFHLMNRKGYSDEDVNEIVDTAHALFAYQTKFYTGHCTGEKPFEIMKKIMGSQLEYIHCGDEIELKDQEDGKTPAADENAEKAGKREKYMKLSRFFAWAAVGCLVLTVITGYKRR